MARVPHPSSGSPKTRDGSGVGSAVQSTGHGAPASASGRGNEPMSNNNWGAKSLRKLQSVGGARHVGANRFVQPTDASTAVVPPPGLGNPRN